MINKILNRIKVIQNYFLLMKVYKRVDHSYNHEKTIFFNLNDVRLEAYYYPILYFFSKSGYNIYLKHNFWYLGHNFNAGKHIFELPNLKIGKPKGKFEQTIYCTDTKPLKFNHWKKTILLDTNVYRHLWDKTPGTIFPFSMHPNMYYFKQEKLLPEYRKKNRSFKLFFSGNCDQQAYDNPIFKDFFSLLNRHETIQLITASLPKETLVLKEKDDYDILNCNQYINKFIFMDWTWNPTTSKNLQVRIPTENWLNFIAQSDFFLCCAGISMPMSHNAIEAMAVGTIPLIEYNEYFTPALKHMKNAVVFKGANDLIAKIKLILSLSESEIIQLRKNTIKYYEMHHKPESFCSKIDEINNTSTSLYLHTTGVSYDTYLK